MRRGACMNGGVEQEYSVWAHRMRAAVSVETDAEWPGRSARHLWAIGAADAEWPGRSARQMHGKTLLWQYSMGFCGGIGHTTIWAGRNCRSVAKYSTEADAVRCI